MKTDYKHSREDDVSISPFPKWKLPFAFSFLAFAIIWRFAGWYYPNFVESSESWMSAQQETLDLSLPENEESTLLIQPTTIARDANQPEWQTFTVQAGDNLAAYFQQAGLDSKALQEVLAIRDAHNHLKRIYPGQILKIQSSQSGRLKSLQFDIDPLTTLVLNRHDDGRLKSMIEDKPIEKRVAFGGGKIYDSLFTAGKYAQLDDNLIMELANIFAYDIDFAQDIQPNDHFKVLFEEYFVNGVKVGNGPIVAAEFVNNGQRYQAIRYTDGSGNASYFSPSGESLKKAFIRTPLQYTRISSHFNLKRLHPVLHKIRAHKGVDYAAPHGTPVKAAGQGKVVFAGKKGGYGNAIILQHGPKYTTLYGHLSKFSKSLKPGASVNQGQIIGYVGSTGLASGPHLHYEFRINGVHHNPLTVPLPQADDLNGKMKGKFLAYAHNLLHMMDRHEKVIVAVNE